MTELDFAASYKSLLEGVEEMHRLPLRKRRAGRRVIKRLAEEANKEFHNINRSAGDRILQSRASSGDHKVRTLARAWWEFSKVELRETYFPKQNK